MADVTTQRLDAFTDAAFAFAVTLLVANAGAPAGDQDALLGAFAAIPAFAIGFGFLAMFWYTHVRWRKLRGDGDWRSMLISLILVFVVLIYIVQLRAMAASFAYFLSGIGPRYSGSIGRLFQIYGIGFVAMTVRTMALFWDALRNPALQSQARQSVRGEIIIWAILTVTGLASIVMASFRATAWAAPFAYSTLPVTIGIFASRWRWGG